MSCQQVPQLITTTTVASTAPATTVSTEDQDPYVFTETVPTTPPILFNAQKSRTRVFIDTQTLTTATATVATTTFTPTPTALTTTTVTAATTNNNKKRPSPTTATANVNKLKFNQKLPLSPLNGNNTKTQVATSTTLAVAACQNGSAATATTTTSAPMSKAAAGSPIFVKTAISQQSQNQNQNQHQLQQQQQHKKPLNVCIVRPQQQQQQQQLAVRQQQSHQNLKAQHVQHQQHQRKQTSSPPPLLQHTPSLWQTPLLLDTASTVVSPPTSPASLPSPPVGPTSVAVSSLTSPTSPTSATAATTALVSPLLIPTTASSTLPPSNFHHNTMAQHLQKVECLKKPKKSTAVGSGGDGTLGKQTRQLHKAQQEKDEMLKSSQQQQQQQQQPEQSQRREFGNIKTVVVPPTTVLMHTQANSQQQQQQQQQQQTKIHKPLIATTSAPPPLQAIKATAAVTAPQHSDPDLNEIPVNVIFRKPQSSEILQAHSLLGACGGAGGGSGGSGGSSVTINGVVGNNAAVLRNSNSDNGKMSTSNNVASTVEPIKKCTIANAKQTKNVKTSTASSAQMQSQPKSSMQTTAANVAIVSTATTLAAPPSLHPAPHVLRDIVFTHASTPAKLASSNETTITKLPAHYHFQNTPHYHRHSPAEIKRKQQNMSSNAKSPPLLAAAQPPPQPPSQPQLKPQSQPLKYDTSTPVQFTRKPTVDIKNIRVDEKCPQMVVAAAYNTSSSSSSTPLGTITIAKNAPKRRLTAMPTTTATSTATAITAKINSSNVLSSPFLKKRSRKVGPLYSAMDNQLLLSTIAATTAENISFNGQSGKSNSRAVAVVKMSTAEIEADTSVLASAIVLPYCIQKHWLYLTRDIKFVGGGDDGGGVVGVVGGVGTTAATKKVGSGVGGKSITHSSKSLSERETLITQRKMLLRREAMQLFYTHSLQKLPMQAARRRLMCVDRLLRKYEHHHGEDEIIAQKKCTFIGCTKNILEMATQCEDHIVDNITQHIFLPCTAKFADNTQCRIPVFDIIHDLPLCVEHARKRDAYNRTVNEQQHQRLASQKLASAAVASTLNKIAMDSDNADDLLLQLQQIQQQHKQQNLIYNQNNNNAAFAAMNKNNKKSTTVKLTTATRKRKSTNVTTTTTTTPANAIARPQKRPRKTITTTTINDTLNPTPPPPVAATAAVAPLQLTSAVLQRKSSTTSLESIASNSQSSNSQPHYISANINMNMNNIQCQQTKIAMPALAPLSGRNAASVVSTCSNTLSSTMAVTAPPPKQTISFAISGNGNCNGSGSDVYFAQSSTNANNDAISQDLRPHEISQLVAQFSVAVNNTNNNKNIIHSSNINENSNSLTTYNCSNSSINNSYNNYIGTNCDSNFTSTLGSSSSLPSSTEELFRQELLSVCENSSVYASSEDTGLGGLSETELIVGPNDADDIPLGDTRLLEEHDLANVLSALPEDAFNELFTAVHQEEREEVERALELADKHLKSLQQTIGSDIDFLGDFPDDDEILADTDAIVSSVMRSPDATSGIDTSTLFLDSGSNSAGGVGGGGIVTATNITDIRGLVQT